MSLGLDHIERNVDNIERAILEDPGMAFELAKALVESACRRILTERDIHYDNSEDLPSIYRKVRQNLPMLPSQESQQTAVRQSIEQTLNGLLSTIQGLAQLRNNLGTVSHGTDGPRPEMETVHAILAAQAADTIVGFLYNVHSRNLEAGSPSESQTVRDSEFDDYVDQLYGNVTIFESEFWASEILLELEPETYRISRADFQSRESDSEEEV